MNVLLVTPTLKNADVTTEFIDDKDLLES